ncbi:hypothetical protein [Archaeoglobus sp.]
MKCKKGPKDSTGLREDNSSFYYAKRSRKKRKSWIKIVVVDYDCKATRK